MTPGQKREAAKAAARAARKQAAAEPTQAAPAPDIATISGIIFKVATEFYKQIIKEQTTGEFNEGDAYMVQQGMKRMVTPFVAKKLIALDKVQAIAREAVCALDTERSDGGAAFTMLVAQMLGIRTMFTGPGSDALNDLVR